MGRCAPWLPQDCLSRYSLIGHYDEDDEDGDHDEDDDHDDHDEDNVDDDQYEDHIHDQVKDPDLKVTVVSNEGGGRIAFSCPQVN